MQRLFLSLLVSLVAIPSFAMKIESTKITQDGRRMQIIVDPTITSGQVAKADILFVIDDSGSMQEEQTALAAAADQIVTDLNQVPNGLDFRIAVTSTSTTGGWSGGGAIVDGRFARPWMDKTTPDFQNKLRNAIMLGLNGNAVESPFDAIRLAFSEPNLSGPNQGFLRPDASLVLVIVTDAEDQSQISAEKLSQFLTNLKGSPSLISVIATIVPAGAPPTRDCTRDDDVVDPTRIEELVGLFKGEILNLCTPGFGSQIAKSLASNAGTIVRTLERTIPLGLEPKLDSVRVTYGTQTLNFGDFDYGWVYSPAQNAAIIGNKFDPNSQRVGTKLIIDFIPKVWVP